MKAASLTRFVGLTLLVLTQTGCSVLDPQPSTEVRARGFGQGFARRDATKIASRYADYAVISELTYEDEDDPGPHCSPDTIPVALHLRYQGRFFKEIGDEFLRSWRPDCAVVNNINQYESLHPGEGLKVDVWLRRESGSDHCAEAVIAFRGTVSASDWMTNFRWLRTGLPFLQQVFSEDRYAQLKEAMPELLSAVQAKGCTSITATGHSLGGGLAQLAARLSRKAISRVYEFNSSDVTGDDLTHGVDVDGLAIERVYERGEFLTYTRRVVEQINPRVGGLTCVPLVIDVRFSFDEPIWASKRHSMRALAYGLVVAAGGAGAVPEPRDALDLLDVPRPHCNEHSREPSSSNSVTAATTGNRA